MQGQMLATRRSRISCDSVERKRWRQVGVTLVELMVTVAVAAVLMAIAVPSFQQLIQSNRVATEANSLVGDLQFARGQAIKEGQPVTVCISSDGSSCSTATSWQTGWIVFTDPNGNQTVDSGEAPLRRQPSFSSTDTFVAANNERSVTYNRDGFVTNLSADTTLTLNTNPTIAGVRRCLTVSRIGRQKVAVC